MAMIHRSAYPGAFGDAIDSYMIKATVTEAVPMMRDTAVNVAGEVIPVTTTSAVNLVGLALDDVTYVSTQATLAALPLVWPVNTANMLRVLRDPFAIYSFNVAGSATSGTALAGTVCVVEETTGSAGGSLVSGAVGAVDRSGGYVVGLTGDNAGIKRRISAWSSGASVTPSPAFPFAIAIGDEFVVVPFSKASLACTLTSDFKEMSGVAAVNAGGEWSVAGMIFDFEDQDDPKVTVEAFAAAHIFNRLA